MHQSIIPIWTGWVPPLPPLGCPQQGIVSDNDTFNIGYGNQNVTIGNPSPVTVTQVTTSTYTALATDYFLCIDVATPVTITLPTGILGTVYVVKDCDGDAATNPITIQGTGGQLVDGSIATINTPFGSITVIFNGSGWSIV